MPPLDRTDCRLRRRPSGHRASLLLLLLLILAQLAAFPSNPASARASDEAPARGLAATGADSLDLAQADVLTISGSGALTLVRANGASERVESVTIRQAQDISATTISKLTATGFSNLLATDYAGRRLARADQITTTAIDLLSIAQAHSVTATAVDGSRYQVPPASVKLFGITGLTVANATGIEFSGAESITIEDDEPGASKLIPGRSYAHADGITATGIDSLTAASANGITATGIDGITVTGIDGQSYLVQSVYLSSPSGITATGIDGITATGIDGITATGIDGITATGIDGITATGIDGITATGIDGITATGIDGRVFSIASSAVKITGADSMIITGLEQVTLSGITSLLVSGLVETLEQGLRSLDSLLVPLLNNLTDDSGINAAIIYHRRPTEDDLRDLSRLGVLGGTRYRVLPVISVWTTPAKLKAISKLPNVRSIYSNRTLELLADAGGGLTGTERAIAAAELRAKNNGLPYTGRGVTVAVLDTGIDSLHPDLAGRVVNNVLLVGTQGLNLGFQYPLSVEKVPNTDLLAGHGTFVAGIISGSGARSNGKYTGVAPGARLLGLSAGTLTLFHILEGFDYLLWRGQEQGVRVVNCSFSAAVAYDPHDPVNIATRMLTGRGINVVFSAGNTGPAMGTLNPYAMAPWVISVGSTDKQGRLSEFSARDKFGGTSGPTLAAPGQGVVSLRNVTTPSLTGVLGILTGDLAKLSAAELPFYTTASGTSFSAPQVSGAIALLLEANPALQPAEIRDLLARTAVPLPPYYSHEVGAGMLNVHAALLEAAYPSRRLGMHKSIIDCSQARLQGAVSNFSGTVKPGQTHKTKLSIPEGAILLSSEITWNSGSLLSLNDLSLSLHDPRGVKRAESKRLNLPLLTGYFESATVADPAPGSWEVQVRHQLALLGSTQSFNGRVGVGWIAYAPINDLGTVGGATREEILQSLRTYAMSPLGHSFRPNFSVSRSELAQALLLGGRVPQYLYASRQFNDVHDLTTRSIVESAQSAPGGPLFYDAAAGGNFRPDEPASRLAAAVALVRAAGLRAEAEKNLGLLLLSDAGQIPKEWRGYVVVALSRGLLAADGTKFSPDRALTRAELAHALAKLADLATQ